MILLNSNQPTRTCNQQFFFYPGYWKKSKPMKKLLSEKQRLVGCTDGHSPSTRSWCAAFDRTRWPRTELKAEHWYDPWSFVPTFAIWRLPDGSITWRAAKRITMVWGGGIYSDLSDLFAGTTHLRRTLNNRINRNKKGVCCWLQQNADILSDCSLTRQQWWLTPAANAEQRFNDCVNTVINCKQLIPARVRWSDECWSENEW